MSEVCIARKKLVGVRLDNQCLEKPECEPRSFARVRFLPRKSLLRLSFSGYESRDRGTFREETEKKEETGDKLKERGLRGGANKKLN